MEILKKYHKLLLALGIVFQILVSLITYHPDIRAFALAGKFINGGEIFTFYDHVSKLPSTDPIKQIYGDDIFIYPPLAYLIPASFYAPFSGILEKSYDEIIYTDSVINEKHSFYPGFLIFKLPFILFGLLTLLLLPKLFNNPKHARLAQLLWVFNPTNLLVVSGMGQVDSILVFFLVASFVFIRKKSYLLAGIMLALSALIKPTGLVLLPLLAFYVYRKDGLLASLKASVPGLFVWAAVIFPFIFSPAFKMYALFAAHTAKTTFAGIAISGGVSIPWFFIFYALIALLLFEGKLSLFKSIGLTVLSVLAFNHFHPQWFLWFTPFLIIYSLYKNKLYLYFALVFCWILIWLSFDPSLHLGMILWFKSSLPPTMVSPLSGSSLVLLARAALVSALVYMLSEKRR
jgi:hypothetical protein